MPHFIVLGIQLNVFDVLPLLPDVASTSPPGSRGFVSNSWSTTSSITDYEVEVVEIRVRDDELYDIIP